MHTSTTGTCSASYQSRQEAGNILSIVEAETLPINNKNFSNKKLKNINMRVVIQRVSHASVTIEGVCKSAIKEGFMILVGIEEADTQEDADWLCKK